MKKRKELMADKQCKINYKNRLIEINIFRIILFFNLTAIYFIINNLILGSIFCAISGLFIFSLVLSLFLNENNNNKKIFLILLIPIFPYKTAVRIIKNEKNESLNFFVFQLNISSILGIFTFSIPIILSNLLIPKNNLIATIVISLFCFICILFNLIRIIFNIFNKNDELKNKFLCKFYLIKEETIKQNSIISIIIENHGILTYKELNKKTNISHDELNKLVFQKSGMNFKEYSLSLKMNYAKSLMEETDMTIDEISKKCGYNSRSAFYKAINKNK